MLNADYKDILSCLNDARADYLLVGAYALAAHGHVRATADIDLWIAIGRDNCLRVLDALTRFGAPLGDVRLEDLMRDDGVLQLGTAPTRIDILSGIDGVSFQDAHRRSLQVEIDGISVRILSKQDLLATKLAANRDQDLGDIAWLRRNL